MSDADDFFFPNKTLEVVDGKTTAWLPISSRWTSIAACSTQLYAQRAGLGGKLIAFDPLFGESIVPTAIPCLPTEVTSSLRQSDRDTATTTLLGPTFVCPGAYSAVQTLLISSSTQQVFCCPSEYGLNVPVTGKDSFPSQCTSLLTKGETLAYQSTTPSGPWGSQTTTVQLTAGPTVVFGMHVNGFNVITAAPVAESSTGTASTTSSVAISSNSSAAATIVAVEDSSLSGGAKAGIGIGVVLGILAVALGAWMLWRRRRKSVEGYLVERVVENPEGRQEMDVPHQRHEMPAFRSNTVKKGREVYEMAGN
ncbi:hypothetical protein BKA64DRAFT_249093 [Cadophora sp. MPI-SDFR-AT-0126]|nr:hypothetical protein BKA64DRAFT_249093 [Leotiomycetes sp. MPI-SDFR-AT-0126]